jgi:hypothetical protein
MENRVPYDVPVVAPRVKQAKKLLSKRIQEPWGRREMQFIGKSDTKSDQTTHRLMHSKLSLVYKRRVAFL